MFKEERDKHSFSWEDLGNIGEGRSNLGPYAPVWAYRLLQFTFRDALIVRLGPETANEILREAGKTAGAQFFENILEHGLGFDEFIAHLQRTLREHKMGILRVEKADLESMSFTLTVAEDLDCSGLHFSDEVVCQYDEGFIAGILEAYTGKPFRVREVDCWASGDRVCRFDANMVGENK